MYLHDRAKNDALFEKSSKKSALHPSLGYYIVKEKKNRINRKKTRKKKGRKKQKGEENWKEEKGEGESVELYFFFFLVSTFLSWPLKRKVENTEWKTEAEIGKRATALFARLPNDFERKLPKLLIGYLIKVDNIIIANIYYEYLFIR